MKAILEFNLDEIDDVMRHKCAVKAPDMASAIWEITHNTKKGLEWSLDGKELDKYEVLEMVFDKIYEILDENHVRIDEFYN
jgi:hypothetical protein